jgi:hypothetical protein
MELNHVGNQHSNDRDIEIGPREIDGQAVAVAASRKSCHE